MTEKTNENGCSSLSQGKEAHAKDESQSDLIMFLEGAYRGAFSRRVIGSDRSGTGSIDGYSGAGWQKSSRVVR